MKFADPFARSLYKPQDTYIFAASQLQGSRETQEDYFTNFNDECFVVADGVGGMPNGEVASQLACETAIWAYKLVRLRRYYWMDKRMFLKRIFRSTNIRVWQKRRESGFEQGLATTLLVCIVGTHTYWIGNAGDSSAFVFHEGTLTKITQDDVDTQGRLTKTVGTLRYGMIPGIWSGDFGVGDILLLATDGLTRYVPVPDIGEIMSHIGDTSESMTEAAVELLKKAQQYKSTDNMTACLIKRIPAPHVSIR